LEGSRGLSKEKQKLFTDFSDKRKYIALQNALLDKSQPAAVLMKNLPPYTFGTYVLIMLL